MGIGRFRITPTIRNGKVAFLLQTGNTTISVHKSKGEASLRAVKLNKAEKEAVKKIKKVARITKRAGLSFADILLEKGTLKTKVKRRLTKKIKQKTGIVFKKEELRKLARQKIKERLKKTKTNRR